MRRKILIIDDETDFCMIMKNYFIKREFDVSVAYTLKEGLALLKEIKPDILFLDNNLPDGDGWDAITKIVELIPQIRAFLVSAHRNKSTVIYPAHRAVTVWEKPISVENLKTIL